MSQANSEHVSQYILSENASDSLGMAVDRVKDPGEPQTQDGASKESRKYSFFSPVDFDRWPRQKVCGYHHECQKA